MILSYQHIEDIAAAILFDFLGDISEWQGAIPIERLASAYLKLDVSYCHLSDDGRLCGLTAYADTEYQLQQGGITKTILLKANQVLLDSSFIQGANRNKLRGKRRFTLAHECAHQILFAMEPEAKRHACRQQYQQKPYSLRDLKSKEDWNEWQANALGSALLMPPAVIQKILYPRKEKIISYGGYFNSFDQPDMNALCRQLAVSKRAASIRLKQLGYLEEKSVFDYDDPVEVWP